MMDEAITAFTKAISIKPDDAGAYYNIGNAIKGVIFDKPNRELQEIIVSLLDKEIYVRPSDITEAVISLLKLEHTLQKHLQLIDTNVIEDPLHVISELRELPLLQKFMSVCPIPDLELEKLLKNLRYSILLNISSLKKASRVDNISISFSTSMLHQ